MPHLVTIDTRPTAAPRESKAPPERLLAGDPSFKSWNQEISRGDLRTGAWEATPGETRSIEGGTFEFCHILSGLIEITPEGGAPVRYGPGDSFVTKPGFAGVWKTIETVRKIHVVGGLSGQAVPSRRIGRPRGRNGISRRVRPPARRPLPPRPR